MSGIKNLIKFCFDRLAALLGLIVLALPMGIIAIIVLVTMKGGPVLYRQVRVGKDGKLFKIHKFRTMTNDQEVSNIAYPNKARITPFGAWLRKHKLDELPELWDVLIGNMSFVGPRPDVPGYADQLQGDDRVVLQMRPGITGPATLKYRDEEHLIETYVKQAKANGDSRPEDEIALHYNDEVIYPDKVRINVDYYRNFSLLKDLSIILHTLFH
ncbi:MAG: sugar transferase [Bacteroidales bacterium]|nr:sugar transferase [Bacteroidales bacterium]